MRKQLIFWHKYLGLALGLLLSVIGLSGSLLVFDHALDETLTPEILPKDILKQTIPLEQVLINARYAASAFSHNQAAESDITPRRIDLARKPGSAHVVRFPAFPGASGSVEVSIDPFTGAALATRIWGHYPMSWVYRLHYTLLAGQTGKYIVGSLGVCLVFFCLSGLVIWWPKNGRWKRALTIRKSSGRFRLYYDLHKTLGFYLSFLLLLLAVTGFAMVFSAPVKKAVSYLLPVEQPFNASMVGGVQASAKMLTADNVVRIGQAVWPNADLKRVYLPTSDNAVYRLRYRQAGMPWTAYSESDIWIHAHSGELIAINDLTQTLSGNQLLAWLFPLHSGDALGIVGRWLILLCGFLPAFLFFTGMYMWWKKRR